MQVKTGNSFFYVYDDLHHSSTGSSSFITNIEGRADQHLQYLPFWELFINQSNNHDFDSRYKFTAKELDNETNYTYFGARYYDSDASIWLSVDPMSDKYTSLSPYAYCANNPVILVDPNVMEIDRFYDENGNFLYDDGVGNNIRILNSSAYNILTNGGQHGLDEVSTEGLHVMAGLLSQSNISVDAELKIMNDFNPTDLPLVKGIETGKGGMTFSAEKDKAGNEIAYIQIRLEKNRELKVSDNYENIRNFFAHENQHFEDYKALGGVEGINNFPLPLYIFECRATTAEMQHDSYQKTSSFYKQARIRTANDHGYPFRMKRLPVPNISY